MQWQMKHYTTLDSTNLEAKRIIQSSQADLSLNQLHGLIVAAEQQTGGKGRLGRMWVSQSGNGLWFSAVIQPKLPLEQAGLYSFAAAVSVAEAIAQETALPVKLKWPNDVLWQGKKLCGILCELVARTKTEYYIVIGIGINVNQQLQEFPPELHDKAISLAMIARAPVDGASLLSTVLQNLQNNCALLESEGFARIRDKWKTWNCVLGQAVSVQQQGKELYHGIAEDITMDGALQVRTPEGVTQVIAGDVSLRSSSGANFFDAADAVTE